MSTTFNLTNTASDVNTAIQAVVGADTTPTDGSLNMVTSSGVKLALNGLATSGTLTTASFTQATLEDSNDGLTLSDTAIPTSKVVKEAVDARKYSTGWTEVSIPSNGEVTGTAPTDMFFIARQRPTTTNQANVYYYINNVLQFRVSATSKSNGTDSVTDASMYMPVAKGEVYKFSFNDNLLTNQNVSLKYKTFG